MSKPTVAFVLLIAFAVTVGAKEATAPAIDADLLAAWKLNIAQADQRVNDAQAVLAKTQEYKQYSAAQKFADDVRASIGKTAQQKTPGYTLDMRSWTFTPQKQD